MPRIFKGTETLLKLFVPRVDEGNLETLKIGLFTDDTNNATEFYGDNMSIDGDTVYLKVNAWSFDKMNDGILNYIAEIEIGEEIIITERQSNYFLKTPNQYVPVGPDVDLSDYYTKSEIDEMLEDIEVDVDLTGYATEQWVENKTYATEQWVEDKTYATEQWVRQQGYVTDSDVNDYVGNEIGQLEEIINTKQDKLISGTNIKTINGNNILGEGDITIEGGGENDCIVIQYVGDYTVDYDGEEVEYNYEGSERQSQNIDAIQKILNGEAKAVYYQYLHEQVYRTDEDGRNNKPTWLMMPMVYRYPSHDNIARFMGVINKDEWGGTDKLYSVGIMLNESDASIYRYNESQIETGSGDSSTSDGGSSSSGAVVVEVSANMGLTNDMAKTIFDNMGNVAIAVKPFFGTVNTKYNVTHCVYRATPSTITTTIVTAMNGTELYQWTITSNDEEYTPTKKTLTFA